MAKLIYAINTSLDGYISDRDGNFAWSEPTAEVFAAITELLRPIGTYLYGRRMYETMAVWDTAHLDPGGPAFTPGLLELERDFAAMWRAADKIVFTKTLPSASTKQTRIERVFDPEQIRQLKATSERDLTVGGASLAAAALAANLVDELHAFVNPIIVGGGIPWLPPDLRIPLELAGERRLGRVVHLHYRPTKVGGQAPTPRRTTDTARGPEILAAAVMARASARVGTGPTPPPSRQSPPTRPCSAILPRLREQLRRGGRRDGMWGLAPDRSRPAGARFNASSRGQRGSNASKCT